MTDNVLFFWTVLAVIGAGAVITDARIGPFTAIGDRAQITRSTVDHSVIMEASVIEDIARKA